MEGLAIRRVAREMGVILSTVCGIGNVVPKMAVKLFNLVTVKKDVEAAWTLYKKMLPLFHYLENAGKTQEALKYALDKMGLCGGCFSSTG